MNKNTESTCTHIYIHVITIHLIHLSIHTLTTLQHKLLQKVTKQVLGHSHLHGSMVLIRFTEQKLQRAMTKTMEKQG